MWREAGAVCACGVRGKCRSKAGRLPRDGRRVGFAVRAPGTGVHRLGGEGGSFAQLRALFARPEVAPRSTQRSSHLGSAAFAPLQTHASQTCALLEGRRSVRAPPPLPPLDGLLDDGQLYAPPPLSHPCILDRLRQPGMSARCAAVTTRDRGVQAWREGWGWLRLSGTFVALSS